MAKPVLVAPRAEAQIRALDAWWRRHRKRSPDLIGSSQSRVAKMEAGDPSVSVDLLIRTLFALGVNRKQVGRAIGATASA